MRFRFTAEDKLCEPSEERPIVNLSDTVREHEIVLKFKVSTTVVSERGNIRLSGEVDMEANPGDVLCLIYDGSLWHETSRMVR